MSKAGRKSYRDHWKLHYERDLQELVHLAQKIDNGSIGIAKTMNSLKHQLALAIYPMIRNFINKGEGPSKCDLAFYHLWREIGGHFAHLELTQLYLQCAIQTSVWRVINRLVGELGDNGFESYAMEAYQESHYFFRSIVKKYEKSGDGESVVCHFLMYIEHYLRLRLKHWYLVKIMGYTYVKKWKGKKEKPYKRRKYPLKEGYDPGCGYESYETNIADKYGSYLATYSIEEMLQIVRKKNPLHAQCLELHYDKEMKVKDIALMLGLPVGTVKSYLSRGKETLRREAKIA